MSLHVIHKRVVDSGTTMGEKFFGVFFWGGGIPHSQGVTVGPKRQYIRHLYKDNDNAG